MVRAVKYDGNSKEAPDCGGIKDCTHMNLRTGRGGWAFVEKEKKHDIRNTKTHEPTIIIKHFIVSARLQPNTLMLT